MRHGDDGADGCLVVYPSGGEFEQQLHGNNLLDEYNDERSGGNLHGFQPDVGKRLHDDDVFYQYDDQRACCIVLGCFREFV